MSVVDSYPLTTLATATAVITTFGLSFLVGKARKDYNVPAPKTTGDVRFESVNRVHQNSVENIVLLLPALWVAALASKDDKIAGSLGLTWSVGRVAYAAGYIQDPKKRSAGFALGFFPQLALVGAAGYYAVKAVSKKYF
ncbi:glutathione S-transferase [Acrasis kona]|uniref:Glutathione S-transferase n=1 Tax=Acrasis kona TaxID=1008807 RepID=A0AAW2ZPL7_9EUKA